jgi:hypothetical protein
LPALTLIFADMCTFVHISLPVLRRLLPGRARVGRGARLAPEGPVWRDGGNDMWRSLVAAAWCVVAAGCFQTGAGGTATRPEDALDVYEAVFRYRLEKLPADVEAYLSVDGKDPPASLLMRLRKDWPKLRPVSEEPKRKGYRVYAEAVRWEGRGAAVVRAGYWFPTRYAGEGRFADHHVARENGRWVVTGVTNEVSS